MSILEKKMKVSLEKFCAIVHCSPTNFFQALGKGFFELTFSCLEDVKCVRSIAAWNLDPGLMKLAKFHFCTSMGEGMWVCSRVLDTKDPFCNCQ